MYAVMAAAVAAAGLMVAAPAVAQVQTSKPATAGPKYKGVFEPVNYPEDLALTDVFFVTPDTGYVAGAAGTILKTTDSGASWTALLGGDPASQERPVRHLRFISETVGWATQPTSTHTNLFRTRDGDSWEQIGSIEEHYTDVAFTSETEGVFAHRHDVYRTQDGGRTWRKTYTCAVKAEIQGLTRTLECEITKLHFASATVGFAVGYHREAALILKTEDGGASWNVLDVIEGELGRNSDLFFLDTQTGYLRLYSGKSYRTTDGGLTWTGMPATGLGAYMHFADPEVGWSFAAPCIGMGCENAKLIYTTDGGKRWSSRSIALPAPVKAFSLPRRDVGYVVGDHGMIYRYRSAPEATPAAPKAILAVAMPALDTAVLAQLSAAEARLKAIEPAVEKSGGAAGADAAASWLEANAPEQLSQLETTIDAVSTGVPRLGRKHRNLNLMLVGLDLMGQLAGQGNSLKESFANLRQARDAGSVSQALSGLHTQLEAMKTSVAAFQTSRAGGL